MLNLVAGNLKHPGRHASSPTWCIPDSDIAPSKPLLHRLKGVHVLRKVEVTAVGCKYLDEAVGF